MDNKSSGKPNQSAAKLKRNLICQSVLRILWLSELHSLLSRHSPVTRHSLVTRYATTHQIVRLGSDRLLEYSKTLVRFTDQHLPRAERFGTISIKIDFNASTTHQTAIQVKLQRPFAKHLWLVSCDLTETFHDLWRGQGHEIASYCRGWSVARIGLRKLSSLLAMCRGVVEGRNTDIAAGTARELQQNTDGRVKHRTIFWTESCIRAWIGTGFGADVKLIN